MSDAVRQRDAVMCELQEVEREMGSINPALSIHKRLAERRDTLLDRLEHLQNGDNLQKQE